MLVRLSVTSLALKCCCLAWRPALLAPSLLCLSSSMPCHRAPGSKHRLSIPFTVYLRVWRVAGELNDKHHADMLLWVRCHLCKFPRRVGCHAQKIIPIWQQEVTPTGASCVTIDRLALWRAEGLCNTQQVSLLNNVTVAIPAQLSILNHMEHSQTPHQLLGRRVQQQMTSLQSGWQKNCCCFCCCLAQMGRLMLRWLTAVSPLLKQREDPLGKM